VCPWTRSYAKSPFLGATCVSRRGFCRFSTFISPRKNNGDQKAERRPKAQKRQCRSKTSSTSVISSRTRTGDPTGKRSRAKSSGLWHESTQDAFLPTPAHATEAADAGDPLGDVLSGPLLAGGLASPPPGLEFRLTRARARRHSLRIHPHRMLSVADHCLRGRTYVNLIVIYTCTRSRCEDRWLLSTEA
jgi:hypothetical protein